jgi:hypothetical protein
MHGNNKRFVYFNPCLLCVTKTTVKSRHENRLDLKHHSITPLQCQQICHMYSVQLFTTFFQIKKNEQQKTTTKKTTTLKVIKIFSI